jgi:hypothetical protein
MDHLFFSKAMPLSLPLDYSKWYSFVLNMTLGFACRAYAVPYALITRTNYLAAVPRAAA